MAPSAATAGSGAVAAAAAPAISDAESSSSTEYVPVSERGPRKLLPADAVREVDEGRRQAKRQRRLERDAAAKRVRLLGERVLQKWGQRGVDLIWEATRTGEAARVEGQDRTAA